MISCRCRILEFFKEYEIADVYAAQFSFEIKKVKIILEIKK